MGIGASVIIQYRVVLGSNGPIPGRPVVTTPEHLSGQTPPAELEALFGATTEVESEAAWKRLLDRFSPVMLRTLQAGTRGYDEAMNRYAFVLESLRKNDFHRLKQYVADGRGSFSTWLVVVTRRLSEDYRRKKYGRHQTQPGAEPAASRTKQLRLVRKRLADFITTELEPGRAPDTSISDPELRLREAELYAALETAVWQLEARGRLLFKLRVEQDLTAKQIARLMDFPSQFHVYRRIKSRLEFLRKILVEMGVLDPEP